MTTHLLFCGALIAWASLTSPAAFQRSGACSQSALATFAALNLPAKIEAFKALAPKGRRTGRRAEHQMECLILSIDRDSLSQFKFELEYDGDYKDIVEYVFHDIDDDTRQGRILAHFRTAARERRVKVLTDVDDTMYANLVDERYEMGTLYAGVVEFYDSLKQEPFDTTAVPVTTLSARPDPVVGLGEERSLQSVREKTTNRLRPSAQSGALASSVLGTLQTLVRANATYLSRLSERIPFGHEDEIGEVKFANCQHFSAVFPEYQYVFVGDSGQADALTAQLLTHGELAHGTVRPLTTFIHDLTQSTDDQRRASRAFRRLTADDLVGEPPATGRGVIVFRNYIHAALVAHAHRDTLENLITADELATITKAALEAFERVAQKAPFRTTLEAQYKADAERAARLLTTAPPNAAAEDIRRTLNSPFWRAVSASQ